MTALLNIPYGPDFYEVTVRDHLIVRIRKYIGDSQTPREVELDDLSEDVQYTILNRMADHISPSE